MTELTTFPLAECAHCGVTGCNKRVGPHHYCSVECADAGPDQSVKQEDEMPRGKANGHATPETPNAPTVPTDEAAPAIVARMAIDALEADKIEGLRDWLRDNVGTADEVLQAVNRWDADPEGMRRELHNTLTFHLSQDDGATNDLTEILNGRRSALPPEPPPRQAEAERPAAEAAAADTTEEPEAELLTAAAGPAPRPAIPRPVALAARKLKGELVNYVLELLRLEQDADRRPWNQRPEQHQRAVIARVSERVEDALRAGFTVILNERARVISGTLDSVTAKADGVKATIKISSSAENLLHLLQGAGEAVQIAVADPNAFMSMGDGVPVVLDQTELPLAAEVEPETAAEEAAEPATQEAETEDESEEAGEPEAPAIPVAETAVEHAVH